MPGRSVLIIISLFVAAIAFFYRNSVEKMTEDVVYKVEPLTMNFFRQKYGTTRNLTTGEARSLYLQIIEDEGRQWQSKSRQRGAGPLELASGCNLIRHRVKIFVRSRDAATNTYLLPLRDAFTHCIWKARSINGILDLPACLIENPEKPCPSLTTLLLRHDGDVDAALSHCWKTSAYFDQYATPPKE